VEKSSRHAKITGDFGESVVLYWLSRSGFECARVDHTGIDLIAKRPRSEERLGISVKTRSRVPGTETDSVNIGQARDLARVVEACSAFQCVTLLRGRRGCRVQDQGVLACDGTPPRALSSAPGPHLLGYDAQPGEAVLGRPRHQHAGIRRRHAQRVRGRSAWPPNKALKRIGTRAACLVGIPSLKITGCDAAPPHPLPWRMTSKGRSA